MNEQAADKVRLPGMGLMIVGFLSVFGNLAIAILQTIGALAGFMALLEGGTLAQWMSFVADQWALLFAVVGFFTSFLVIAAGARLRGLRSPGLVYLGAVLAMLPCCLGVPCCVLGAPMGLWALVVLQDAEVKASFV